MSLHKNLRSDFLTTSDKCYKRLKTWIRGLQWEDYDALNGELRINRAIWNGKTTEPKTRKSRGVVPVIAPLAQRLAFHRTRRGNPTSGPIFPNQDGKAADLNNVLGRVILPTLNRCEVCKKSQCEHSEEKHEFKRDASLPEWHGWHAARRGLGTNLYRLGVPDKTIQAILRHSNVAVTQTYYIKTAADDTRAAMQKLETALAGTVIGNEVTTKQVEPKSTSIQ